MGDDKTIDQREREVSVQERGLNVSLVKAERRAAVEFTAEGGAQIANLDQAMTFAQTLIENGSAPKGATAGGIVASVQAGREIRTPARPEGLGPMQSIQLIPSINGRPFIMGDLAKAVVLESGVLKEDTAFEEWLTGERGTDDWTAHCKSHRKGDPEPVEHTFSWADAKRANLSSKSGPWKEYPQRQLMYRARGFHVRDQYAGLMLGLHTYEEGRDMPRSAIRDVTPPTGPDPLFEQVDDGRSPALTGDVNRLATEGPAATPEPLVDTEPQDAEVIESEEPAAPPMPEADEPVPTEARRTEGWDLFPASFRLMRLPLGK